MTHFKTLASLHRQEARHRFHDNGKIRLNSFQDVILESVRLAGRSSKVLNRLLELDFWCRSWSGLIPSYATYYNLRKYKGVTIIEEKRQ